MTGPAVTPQVVDCAVCGGRGVVLAERVPAGADLAAGLTDLAVCLILCPAEDCQGRSASIKPAGTPTARPAGDWFGIGLVSS